MDESGLFCCNGTHESYLTDDESRSKTYGAELQTNNQRLSIVMAVNADVSNSFSVDYVRQPANPVCFLQRCFNYLKKF